MARAVAYKVVGGWVVADNDLTPRTFLSDPEWNIYYQYPTLSAWTNTSTIGVVNTLDQSDPYQPYNRRITSYQRSRNTYWAKIGSNGVYEYEVSDVYYETYVRYPIYTGPTPCFYCAAQAGSGLWTMQPSLLTSFEYNMYLTFSQKEGPNTGIFVSVVSEFNGIGYSSEADMHILVNDYYAVRQTHNKSQDSYIYYKLISNSPRKQNVVNNTNLTGRNGSEIDETTNICTITPTTSLAAYRTTRDVDGKYWLSDSAPCNHNDDYVIGSKTITGNYIGFYSKVYDVHEIPAFTSERFEGTALNTLYEAILYYGYLDDYDQSFTPKSGTVWTSGCNNDYYTAISTVITRKYFYGIEYGNRTVAPSGNERSKHYSILMNTDSSKNHTILGYLSYGVPFLIEVPSEYPPADPIDDNPDTLPDPGGDPQSLTFRWETYKAIRSGRELRGK